MVLDALLVMDADKIIVMDDGKIANMGTHKELLKTSEIGISYAFLNQPCEVTTLSIALRKELPINKEYPTLILRIGYANPVPYSPRKNIETLLR